MLAIIIALWILATDPPHINPTWICPNGQSGIPPLCG